MNISITCLATSPTDKALRDSHVAQSAFLEEVKIMGAGQRPVDVDRLVDLANVVLQAHEAYRFAWASEGFGAH